MTTQLIPTSNDPFYTQTTTLDGTPFILSFLFNQREYVWYLDVYTQEGDLIRAGIKLVPNIPLLRRIADTNRPAGELVVACNDPNDDSPPGIDDLGEGSRCQLLYIPQADLNPSFNDA